MTEELVLGLTPSQHYSMGSFLARQGDTTLPPAGVVVRPAVTSGVCRVILFNPDEVTYQPKALRKVAIFALNPRGQQWTVEFSGHELEGDLILTIDSVVIRLSCKSTTEQLQQKLVDAGISAKDCRATVFPGLWEFDFNEGRFLKNPPALFRCEPWEPPSDDDESPFFIGELTVTNEAWVSVRDDADRTQVLKVNARDWIPHQPGAVKPGAIGAGVWSTEAGWLVLAWQCRDYSFRTTY